MFVTVYDMWLVLDVSINSGKGVLISDKIYHNF